ncbi:PREDICTED: matrix extracellular phosphoglycoprotein [Chinchilla lanigera]|uniref:matrix extracellular phosphoglycoprotein n=1 Tax=Chinchilla lanigera TaxID=34839 RepID=UPI00038E9C68|nr:PREDICTED: matrix extracellular phosphoglycoprotein [Chinchilla lanigera]
MQAVCVRLLLFCVTWAATQEEKSKDDTALHHFDERRNQDLSSRENIVLESKRVLSLFEANGNNQSSTSPHFAANRQTLTEEYRVIHKGKAHRDLVVPKYPESTGPKGAKDGDDGTRSLHVQEVYGTAPVVNKVQGVMRPMTGMQQWEEEDKEKNPRNVPSKIPAHTNHAKAHSKGKKSHQPSARAQNSPVKSRSTRHIQHSTRYLPQLSKERRIPSDFEGSGYTDLQGKGDSDVFPFSGDGQPFEDIPGKGEAVGPDLESTDRQTGLLDLSEPETVSADTRGLGPNEIPEGEEGGDHTLPAKAGTKKEAGIAVVSRGEGSRDITGSTNFRDLPGKEGNRVDAGSQNAHQGKIELHYPSVPFQGQIKGGSGVSTESAAHNEIPKHGKGGPSKSTELSGRNQEALGEKHRFSSKGESRGLVIPSHGLDNEIKNEISSRRGPHHEGNRITHRGKAPYVSHGQHGTVRGKGGSPRRGSWAYRRLHSHSGFSSSQRSDSSESSDSSSSSESAGR